MASRFSQQRDSRSSLFAAYENNPANRGKSHSPYRSSPTPNSRTNGHTYAGDQAGQWTGATNSTFVSYPGANGQGLQSVGYRSATPNNKGQYSDAVLSELENQNEEQLAGMSARVKMLKDITSAIGEEIRDSTALAEKMNDSFEGTRLRIRGTMTRMLRMAERTGVGWRVWLGFFSAVVVLFWYVWLL